MDEVSFGPGRESRLPSRCRRALAAVAATCVVAAAGVVLVTKVTGVNHGASPPPRVATSERACPPAQAARPDLAGLPAGMRPGALEVIVTAQFSGECGAS